MDIRFATAGMAWGLGLLATVGWRLGRLGAWAPVSVAVLELGTLLFVGPSWWGWKIRLPESSPVLQRLAELADVGLVGGRLLNVPVDAGLTTAYPNLGITPPPPNYLLETAMRPPGEILQTDHRWQVRFGVTHGVWGADDDVRGFLVMAVIPDPALDRVMASVPHLHGHGPWKLVHDSYAFPPAWVARLVVAAKNWPELHTSLSMHDYPDQAWFLPEDLPPPLPEPAARDARVLSWDGRTATVEHDGSCILILRRAFYPGWSYRVDDGPAQPVLRVNGGLQGVPLQGAGTSRVVLRYRPTGLAQAATVTLTALAAAALVLAAARWRALRNSRVPVAS